MRMPYKIEAGVVAVSMLLSAFVSPLSSSAKGRAIEQEMPLDGKIYEFSKNSSYEIDTASVSKPTSQTDTLGSLTISGEITEEYQKDGFTAYEIADDGIISLAYEYDDTLLNGRAFEIDPIWRSCRESSCGIHSDLNIVKQADISIM